MAKTDAINTYPLPKELNKPCEILLKKIYRAFPGEDAPDLFTDIKALAQKAFDAGYTIAFNKGYSVGYNDCIAEKIGEL